MASHPQSKGKCYFCEQTFAKGGMSKHLQSCDKRQTELAAESHNDQPIIHLQMTGTYAPDYWLHVEMSGNATLKNLDQFLRDIWLECCGHMSAFRINGISYFSGAARELGGRSFNTTLDNILKPGMSFAHEYDFGTTTDLTLKVIDIRDGEFVGRKSDVHIMARNLMPAILCSVCNKELATQVCTMCLYEGTGWLCKTCAGQHKCGEDMLLPVVNSPRVGECGYTGPSLKQYL